MPSVAQKIIEKPEPKVLEKAGERVVSTNLSIKKMLNPQTENGERPGNSSADLPRESFHFDDVKMSWRRFANEMKQQGRETFYNAMIKRNPLPVSDTHFVMEVDNQVQVDLINADKEKLISFLRHSLKNYEVTIEIRITENQQEEVKFLTGKDKFAMMSRKFPYLHTLKDTFGLEIEY